MSLLSYHLSNLLLIALETMRLPVKILQLDKFEGADLRYGCSFFEILAQKHLIKAFFVQNLDIFLISRNFALR